MDIDPRCHPDYPCDILRWDFQEYPPGFFDVIAASVPCIEYSIALTTRPRNMLYSDKLVCRTRKIIEYFNPRVFWIENPRTGYLKRRDCIQGLPWVDLDYCQFCDWGYKKPTDFGFLKIWHNFPMFCVIQKRVPMFIGSGMGGSGTG